jgi:hypothetical protein
MAGPLSAFSSQQMLVCRSTAVEIIAKSWTAVNEILSEVQQYSMDLPKLSREAVLG